MRKVLVKKLVRQLLVRTQVPPSLYPQGPDIWTTRKKDGWWNTYYAQVYRLCHCPLDCLNSNLHLQHRNGRQKWLCQFYFSQSQPLTKCYEMPRIDHSLKSWMENHIKYADLVNSALLKKCSSSFGWDVVRLETVHWVELVAIWGYPTQ